MRIGASMNTPPTAPLSCAPAISMSNGEVLPFCDSCSSPAVAMPPSENIRYAGACVAPMPGEKCATSPGKSRGCVASDHVRSTRTS